MKMYTISLGIRLVRVLAGARVKNQMEPGTTNLPGIQHSLSPLPLDASFLNLSMLKATVNA